MEQTIGNKYKNVAFIACTVLAILAIASIVAWQIKSAQGAAPGGAVTATATSSAITTSATVPTYLFATSTPCMSRTITTGTKNLRLKFADAATSSPNVDAFTLSATAGHLQPASTTVTYDAGTYGCGAFTGISTDIDTLYVTEFRGFR